MEKKQKQKLVVPLGFFKCGETQRDSLTAHIIKVEPVCSASVISLLADRGTDVVEVFVNAGSYLAFINLVNIGRTCKRDNVIVVLN